MRPIRLATCLVVLFACFYGLGAYPLLDNVEGMYAAIARDMLSTGQFTIPHLNTLPYLEKPPLLYWLVAASMKLFGVNAWAARLPIAATLALTAWLMARFLRRAGHERAGLIAALILASSLPLLAMGRMILCDMLMTCFLTAALMRFFEWQTSAREELGGFYAYLALAVLAKGFVAMALAGGAIVLYLWWQGCPSRDYRGVLSPGGILIFLIIAAPWHVLASREEPGFAWFYFINEHVLCFLNLREPHDYYTGPPWYYLPRIAISLLPWIAFLPLLPAMLRHKQPIHYFLWSWFLFALAFFSAASGKANYYMVAGTPPLIMLLALAIDRAISANSRALPWLAAACLLLTAGIIAKLPVLCQVTLADLSPVCNAMPLSSLRWLTIPAAIGIVLCWRLPQRWLPALIALPPLLLLPLVVYGTTQAEQHISQKAVADWLTQGGYRQIALYQEFEELSSLAFYMHTPPVIVDSLSKDLLYGQREYPKSPVFMTLETWLRESSYLPLVILNKRVDLFMQTLRSHHVPRHAICIWYRFSRVSVAGTCRRNR